jgi:hypothetical protein
MKTMLGRLRSRSDPTVGSAGRSAGGEQWSIDLSRYAGKQVEVSIAYLSDWSIQGLGAFVNDTAVSSGEATSFEDGLGGWAVTGPPPGTAPNSNDWTRTTAGFPEGAAVSTRAPGERLAPLRRRGSDRFH